jgi:uncharacterized protein
MIETLCYIIIGAVSGIALGLTGSGGSLLAVPMLVSLTALTLTQAIALSLVGIALTAWGGLLVQFRSVRIDWHTTSLLALTGLLSSPFGTYLGTQLHDSTRWLGFAALMLVIAERMWHQRPTVVRAGLSHARHSSASPFCAHAPHNTASLTSPCTIATLAVGLLTGLLAGVFGVGGGFLLVPAMHRLLNIPIRQAVTNSIVIIGVISGGAAFAQMDLLTTLHTQTLTAFPGGGLAGFLIGYIISKNMDTQHIQRGFALLTAAIGLGIMTHTLLS